MSSLLTSCTAANWTAVESGAGCTAGKSGAVGVSSLDVDAIGHASSFAAAGDVDLPSTPEYT